jgi:hypothetical protein
MVLRDDLKFTEKRKACCPCLCSNSGSSVVNHAAWPTYRLRFSVLFLDSRIPSLITRDIKSVQEQHGEGRTHPCTQTAMKAVISFRRRHVHRGQAFQYTVTD